MKKYCAVFASILFATAYVSLAQSSVPYQDTFESYDSGSNLVGSVWAGDTSALAVVTNWSYPPPGVGYPVTNTTHDKVMTFSEGTITNEFDGTTSNLTVLAIDTMLQPVFSEEPPTGNNMASISNSHVSLYIDTNGYVNVYHGLLISDLPGEPDSTEWLTLTNIAPLSPGSWCRLTLVMNYRESDQAIFFKVGINGKFINSPNGYTDPDLISTYPNPKNGPWLCAAKWTEYRLHQIALSGTGKLDDMVVTTDEIVFGVDPLAIYGTPILWMQQNGLNTNGVNTWDDVALADQDGDGAATWAEYVAGTGPTNEFSKLIIISQTFSNGFPIIKWIGTTNAIYPYSIQWSSNLMSISAWTTVTGDLPRLEGTNTILLPPAPVSPAFMRVNVTTN